jgi:superfamily I DNA and/or RNA helicase
LLFERLIVDEFNQQKRKADIRPIAHRLNKQHRMHPAIARVVSRAFYERELETHATAASRFVTEACPAASAAPSVLPQVPIFVVDMPFVQGTLDMKRGEEGPRWHNPAEVEIVDRVIRLLKPAAGAKKPPSLAVLSPYGEQVRRLSRRIDENVSSYPGLSGFRRAVQSTFYCGTVDSFQGNEADVVVVSLVRNNHHSGVRSVLGFLSDARRMNVLLSRARWRMILIGSLDFLRGVIAAAEIATDGPDLRFFSELLAGIEEERRAGTAMIVPAARLLEGTTT